MKAVAVALVLIAVAAVVLWYGNTLNSWVLGGLIGGLAALLLSIPISLLVFSYLSKRHDERLQAEEQEFMEDDYPLERVPARAIRRPREVEGYVITDETPPTSRRDEDDAYAPRAQRALPPPTPQRPKSSERLPAIQQGASVPMQRTQADKTRGKATTVLRATTKKIGEPTSSISQHRSEALRLARLEAAQLQQQQDDNDVEVLPTNNPRKSLIARPTQSLARQNNSGTSIVPARPATRQQPQPSVRTSRQTRRVVDATGSQEYSLPNGNDVPIRRLEPSTDSIEGTYPQTGPLRRGSQNGRSRDTTQEYEQRATDSTHGSVNKPLLRRAPYMYEDDPLRQELAQHLEAPTVLRSSRYNEDDEND